MSWVLDLHLVRLFNLYLALLFALSTYLRVRQYTTVLSLVRRLPERWPRLFQLVREHANIFLTWGTVTPLLATLGVWAVHALATYVLLPAVDGYGTVGKLAEAWPCLVAVCGTGAVMIAFDLYSTLWVSEIDQKMIEGYFDQAEFWLKSWSAPVVKVLSFGYVNPRQLVAQEVRTALTSVSEMANGTLWWVVWQISFRVAFGLSVWVSYVLGPWVAGLVGNG